uniref:Uncharacterized protein n=1 Tax=Oryza glumipatula TaxID=40148 RepID=A0A0E0BPH8_9ORYZ
MDDSSVAGADHNVLVLYVGSYRLGIPSMGMGGGGGFYLHWLWVLGVLRHALPSDYVLADLVLTGNLPKATLWTWWSSGPFARRWIDKSVILPPEVCMPTAYNSNMLCADTTFSFGTGTDTWVDLLTGILTCNMLAPEPVFQFIPLSEGCSISLLAFNMGGKYQRSVVPCAVATTASSGPDTSLRPPLTKPEANGPPTQRRAKQARSAKPKAKLAEQMKLGVKQARCGTKLKTWAKDHRSEATPAQKPSYRNWPTWAQFRSGCI